MVLENRMFKLAVTAAAILTLSFICFTYLFFEKYITEEEISITIINKEKFGNEVEKYLIFTPNEVFENTNSFYHRKTNAEMIYRKLERGATYRVKVVGLYMPNLFRLRNITEILETEISQAH